MPARELFIAAARGKALAAEVLATGQGVRPGAFAAAATRTLPYDIASFTGRGTEHATAIQAARHLGDRLGQANALLYLGPCGG